MDDYYKENGELKFWRFIFHSFLLSVLTLISTLAFMAYECPDEREYWKHFFDSSPATEIKLPDLYNWKGK